jgi:VWFA-related protein
MSETADGTRSNTKTTKATKLPNNYWFFVILVVFVIFVAGRVPWAVSPQQTPPPPTQAQQRPVFRGGTHFVRVDAYPFVDGKIVEGLTPADFEVLEDGKPQKIESFDFMRFDSFTPDAERHDPVSQRAGFDLAADPRYRLFVVYVDLTMTKSANNVENLPLIEQPLVNFFDRIVGPQDLYGLMTTRNSVKDLVLAQKTTVTNSEIKDLLRAKYIERDEADEVLGFCDFGPLSDGLVELLKYLYRADASYTNLHELTLQLGSLRQERKNLVLVTNLLPRWGPNQKLYEALVAGKQGGVSQNGIQNGRLTPDNREIYSNGRGGSINGCMAEATRLALMDFEPRYRELVDEAVRQNVSVYVVTPSGLQAPFSYAGLVSTRAAYEDLRGLAEATDGLSMVNTNDLNAAFRRIADDLAGYYVLGYYTTNTTFDGGIRKITVKLKGKTIRARRQYRAPTEEEIATMAQGASASRAAAEPSGPPAVIGEPAAYRVSRTQPPERVKLLEFIRSDRLRVEWPVLAPLDRREARMLDTAGKPMPFEVPVAEGADGKTVVVELPLAPFGRGGYSIELTAASGGKTEQRRLTFIMK